MIELVPEGSNKAKIKVVGVGGSGGNAMGDANVGSKGGPLDDTGVGNPMGSGKPLK